MSRFGLRIARLFGQRLPSFRSLDEAKKQLFEERDCRIAKLKALTPTVYFIPDETPESLKGMEEWYFKLHESDGFRQLGVTRQDFERCMATYFCHVAVANCSDAEWHVSEYAFQPGKYEIGVRRGALTLNRSSFEDHYAKPGNLTRKAIFREYQRYFGR